MDFEKLGLFYLGKHYDLENQQLLNSLTMYDARDLTTHAVCVGMTGSGKTGLCLTLLEEAAIDRVPAIIIDPKGDITNLLLTFPDLQPENFRPWVNMDDARRKGLSLEDFATEQAQLWTDGLASWGQDGERIRMLRETADFRIFTPGSDAGMPVSILQSFACPALSWDTESEILRERIQGTVSALLGLVGIDADPLRSREHILLSNLLEHFWRQGQDLDLPNLIMAVQNPPIKKLGVFDVDTFFSPDDRFELAMTLNNIIAAPAFQSWLQGEPLDIANFLSTPDGKPRHSIFYIAHLSDAERMFFVTMLLNHLIGWMRAQPGTTSLRALLYMDEVFGFFPPVANPPSKKPLLTLLKQARAFGLGCVLTTQNPADLDYKGLTNAGTWFIGRLQAERDKERVLEGLESASLEAGVSLNRKALDKIISSLGKRVFLLHNVHESAPVVFQTRWAMSYMRGPLTRDQVREIVNATPPAAVTPQPAQTLTVQSGTASQAVTPPPPAPPVAPQRATGSGAISSGASDDETVTYPQIPPVLPHTIQQVYLPVRKANAQAVADVEAQMGRNINIQTSNLFYIPCLLGTGEVHFLKQRSDLNVDETEAYALLATFPEGAGVLRWEQAQAVAFSPQDLLDQAESGAYFKSLPDQLGDAKAFMAFKKDLEDYIYRTRALTLLYSPALKVYARPGETERDFRMRIAQLAREQRDTEIDALRERYAKRTKSIEDRLMQAQAALERKKVDLSSTKQSALISTGESVLGLFTGRRRSISTTANRYTRVSKAKLNVEAAEEKVVTLQEDLEKLQAELKKQTEGIVQQWETASNQLEEMVIRPRRTDVEVALFALAWTPYWRVQYEKDAGVETALVGAF